MQTSSLFALAVALVVASIAVMPESDRPEIVRTLAAHARMSWDSAFEPVSPAPTEPVSGAAHTASTSSGKTYPKKDMYDTLPALEALRDHPDLDVTVLHDAGKEGLVLMIDDFLTPDECEVFVAQAKRLGLERSTVVAGTMGEAKDKFKRATSMVRTSSNTWCTDDECFYNPVVERVGDRIADLLWLPSRFYSEHFQLLRYEHGEYYKEHHDYIPEQRRLPGNVRLYTFFLYLTDVEEGGETEFTDLGLKVKPKRGRAVVWCNTTPGTADQTTYTSHQANPVIKGTKYAANLWIHSEDFITPWKAGAAP